MKAKLLLVAIAGLALPLITAPATVFYVDVNNSNPFPPYTNWATAATNIQDAVDVATNGDLVLATNGIYETGGRRLSSGATTNRVIITNAITLRSVNGPAVTIIKGYQVPWYTNEAKAIRCVYLGDGATISGFTLTNGATMNSQSGGAICCQSTNATVTNCVLIGNAASAGGGGAYRGRLLNCSIISNSSYEGGGIYGGATYNCYIIGNRARDGGGVRYPEATLNNCTVTGNSAELTGGGVYGGNLNNCVIAGNSAGSSGGGYALDVYDGNLTNCTIVANSADGGCGGVSRARALYNCIIYSNSNGLTVSNYSFLSYTMHNCCTIPTNGLPKGNITNAPVFVDPAGGNYRPRIHSPTINAGNNENVASDSDRDGRPRIVDGGVDMGAYEFQDADIGEFIGWLEQYRLPTDGSTDYADSDSDCLNNWQEWVAGTIPTNAFSVLKMLSVGNSLPGLTVTWQSATNRTYFLERSINLEAQPAFSTIQSNIASQGGTTTCMDAGAVGPGPFFYRVGVQ